MACNRLFVAFNGEEVTLTTSGTKDIQISVANPKHTIEKEEIRQNDGDYTTNCKNVG
jgi:hypothetical protein